MESSALSVLLIAADAYFARGLSAALAEEGVLVVLEGAHDVVLLDARGGAPMDVGAPFVALVEDEPAAARALAAGARGVLPIGAAADSLASALAAVAGGLLVLDPRYASMLAPAAERDDKAPTPPEIEIGATNDAGLTPREREVLVLLVDGLTNREIAAQLDVSVHTAKFHVNSILQKLGAMTRTEAVVIAARSGLVEI